MTRAGHVRSEKKSHALTSRTVIADGSFIFRIPNYVFAAHFAYNPRNHADLNHAACLFGVSPLRAWEDMLANFQAASMR